MTTLSRRKFLRFLPAVAAAPLAQWPTAEPEPKTEPGADTALNLTWRMSMAELEIVGLKAMDTTQNRWLDYFGHHMPNPEQYRPERPRGT